MGLDSPGATKTFDNALKGSSTYLILENAPKFSGTSNIDRSMQHDTPFADDEIYELTPLSTSGNQDADIPMKRQNGRIARVV